MKRNHFLLTALASLPAFAFSKIADDERTNQPFIVRSGLNRSGKTSMKFMGVHPNDVVVSRKDTDDALSVFLFTGLGNVGTPLHVHFHQDEFFYVVQGRYRFVCGKVISELNEGDTIFLPRNIAHQWLQLSEHGKLLYTVNPAGTLEDMFTELDELKAPPSEETMKTILSKHGQKLLGPPMTL